MSLYIDMSEHEIDEYVRKTILARYDELIKTSGEILKLINADCKSGGDYHDTAMGRFSAKDCPICKFRSAVEIASGHVFPRLTKEQVQEIMKRSVVDPELDRRLSETFTLNPDSLKRR